MDQSISVVEIVLRLLAAVVCGGIVGWEREAKGRPAGLRTHMMVALGAGSFTLAALDMAGPGADPVRILQGVVTGIGFLGAGSIMQSRGEVQGMTTAAGIWVVGAIGAACGAGDYIMAAVTLAFAFTILFGVKKVEDRAFRKEHAEGLITPAEDRAPATESKRAASGSSGFISS
jgi:putative Mg2+ transporter-C (MgtC) family protein